MTISDHPPKYFAAMLWILTLLSVVYAGKPHNLRIGTREVAPFAMQDENGNWSGITIELWEKIASELNIGYDYKPLSLNSIFDALQDTTIDIGAAALSITSDREAIVDFSHSFFTTGLGIAVVSKQSNSWSDIVMAGFSRQFLEVVAVLASILFIFGVLIWFFERKQNRGQFSEKTIKGIGAGFWWSAVTMTTVGYGDKAPVTLPGRLVAIVWMFTGIIIISTLTASITSALTVASLEAGITGPKDLPNATTATIENSTSADYLSNRGIYPKVYSSVEEGLSALEEGVVDAFVFDAPTLIYLINHNHSSTLRVLPARFEQQQYGIALPFNSSLRQEVNQILLSLMERGVLEEIRRKYLGE